MYRDEFGVRISAETVDHLDSAAVLDGVTVVGTPLHRSEEALVTTYRGSSLDEFLSFEARYSMGSYVLIDPSIPRLVTAPGYAGGYLREHDDGVDAATTLGTIRDAAESRVDVRDETLAQYVTHHEMLLPPFRSLYADTDRLPPAYLFEFGGDGVERRRAYIADGVDRDPPETFGAAIEEAFGRLGERVAATDRTLTVQFSGGVDSLCLLLAARTATDCPVRVVTCDQGRRTDGPEMARQIADNLGADLTVIGSGWDRYPPRNEEVVSSLTRGMRRDITPVTSAHTALPSDVVDRDDVLLSGMNFGVIPRGRNAGNSMPIPSGFSRLSTLKYCFSNGIPVKRLLGEFTHTSNYIENHKIRKIYEKYYDISNKSVGFDSSEEGYFTGVLNHNFPNIVYREGNSPQSLYDTKDTVRRFLDDFPETPQRRSRVDGFYYYWLAQNAQKLLCSNPGPSMASNHLPIMWGPLTTFLLTADRSWDHPIHPKRWYHRYVTDVTGNRYHDLTGLTPSDTDRLEDSTPAWEMFFDESTAALIEPDRSTVLPRVTDDSVVERVREQYERATDLFDVERNLSTGELGVVSRVVNAERLLGCR